MRSIPPTLFAACLLAPLYTASQGCTITVEEKPADSAGCEYDGEHYAAGEQFPASDGCNSCICGSEDGEVPPGEVGCTLRWCGTQCEYGGELYSEGMSFPAQDGCNTCTCTSSGVACTDAACGGQGGSCTVGDTVYAHGQPVPSGDCNACSCQDGSVACTAKWCGCESEGSFYEVGQTFKQDCADCVCTADGVACDDVDCGALPQIELCDPMPADGNLQVTPLGLEDDALTLQVTLGGGCREHPMRLCTDGSFLESNPVQLNLWVVDDGEPDPCLALITEQLVFDVSPLQQTYAEAYQATSGTILLRIDGQITPYTF